MHTGRLKTISAIVSMGILAPYVVMTPVASAQAAISGGTIQSIRVEGAQRIDPQTVVVDSGLQVGDSFNAANLNQALKNIYASRLFADVGFKRSGSTLVISVQENAVINQIAFEGNLRIKDETLKEEITLRPREVFTRAAVQEDVVRIKQVYQAAGRYGVSVKPRYIERQQGRVDLVFEILEGGKTRIRAINFVGNVAYSDKRLQNELISQRKSWWRFFSGRTNFDPDRLQVDVQRLTRFYNDRGYADFETKDVLEELTPDRRSFDLSFTVDEGRRYFFGKVKIETTLRDLDTEALLGDIDVKEGYLYRATDIEKSVTLLNEKVGDLGYAFVQIDPEINKNKKTGFAHITFKITEGEKVYVERINIDGNDRTIDKVIRREMDVSEGDAFSSVKLRRSKRRLSNLGYFKEVEFSNRPGSEPDRAIVDVQVEEQSTGSFLIGGGYGTSSGPFASVTLSERNFLGRGQTVSAKVSYARENQDYSISFSEPYLFGYRLEGGFDLFYKDRQQVNDNYDDKRYGISLFTRYNLSEDLTQRLYVRYEKSDVSNIDEGSSLAIREQEGKTDRFILGQTLFYDRRDNAINPTKGYNLRLTTEWAGLAGDVDYLKVIAGANFYFPITEKVILAFRNEVGSIYGLNQDTRVTDRFTLGGRRLRGFDDYGVSPRDETTKDAIGGDTYYLSTLEMKFPLGLPDELKVDGRVFLEAGSSWLSNVPENLEGNLSCNTATPRVTAGIGVTWVSPFGQINLDWGYPLNSEDCDNEQSFQFSVGTTF